LPIKAPKALDSYFESPCVELGNLVFLFSANVFEKRLSKALWVFYCIRNPLFASNLDATSVGVPLPVRVFSGFIKKW